MNNDDWSEERKTEVRIFRMPSTEKRVTALVLLLICVALSHVRDEVFSKTGAIGVRNQFD